MAVVACHDSSFEPNPTQQLWDRATTLSLLWVAHTSGYRFSDIKSLDCVQVFRWRRSGLEVKGHALCSRRALNWLSCVMPTQSRLSSSSTICESPCHCLQLQRGQLRLQPMLDTQECYETVTRQMRSHHYCVHIKERLMAVVMIAWTNDSRMLYADDAMRCLGMKQVQKYRCVLDD